MGKVRDSTARLFEVWIGDEANVRVVLDAIADGMTLQKVSVTLKQPYRCLHGYFHSSAELAARYDAARKAWADQKQDEALEIADQVGANKDEVAKAKLQVETRHAQAKAYHRDRWGDKVQVEKDVTVRVDAGLLGSAAELLSRISGPGRVLEAEPPSVALPVPAVSE